MLANRWECPEHHAQGVLVADNCIDGYCWKCDVPYCKKIKSVRMNSFFSQSKLEIWQILTIAYLWFSKSPQTSNIWRPNLHLQYFVVILLIMFILYKVAIKEAHIPTDDRRSKSSKTTSDWYNFCRDVCRESLLLQQDGMIGGPGKVVEIDESAFSKRKYHRGALRRTHWVFGGVERGTNKCFFVSVRRRNKRTLWPLIFRHIAPGTKIISDGWAAYRGINAHGYEHETVNHSVTFKDPITGAHSNTIEGSWFHLKRSLPQAGTRKTMFPNHFAMYIWRKKFGASDFKVFLEHVGRVHNPNVPPRFQYDLTQNQQEFESDSEVEEIEVEDEPASTLVHNGVAINFDELSDEEDEDEEYDEIDEMDDEHELLM